MRLAHSGPLRWCNRRLAPICCLLPVVTNCAGRAVTGDPSFPDGCAVPCCVVRTRVAGQTRRPSDATAAMGNPQRRSNRGHHLGQVQLSSPSLPPSLHLVLSLWCRVASAQLVFQPCRGPVIGCGSVLWLLRPAVRGVMPHPFIVMSRKATSQELSSHPELRRRVSVIGVSTTACCD